MPILLSFLNREKIRPATKSVASEVKTHPMMSSCGPVFSAARSGGSESHPFEPDMTSASGGRFGRSRDQLKKKEQNKTKETKGCGPQQPCRAQMMARLNLKCNLENPGATRRQLHTPPSEIGEGLSATSPETDLAVPR